MVRGRFYTIIATVKRILIVFSVLLICLFTLPSLAYSSETDSSLNQLTTQIDLIAEISNLYPDSALKLANEALTITESEDYLAEKAHLQRLIGLIWYYKVDYVTSLEYFMESLDLCKQIGNKAGEAAALNNISIIYRDQDYLDKALELDLQVLEMRKQLDNFDDLAGSLNNVAVAYMDMEDYEKALDYFWQAVSVAKQHNITNSLDLCYNNIGALYLEKSELDSAFKYFNISLGYSTPLNHKQMMQNSMVLLGQYYLKIGNPQRAIECLERGLKLANEIQIVYEIEWVAESLHEAYAKVGNYSKAYEIHKLYKEMADSANNLATIQKITKIEAEISFNKERELEKIVQDKSELENQLKFNRARQLRDIAITIGIALFFILTFMYRNNRTKTRDNKILQQQKAEIEKQKTQIETLNNTKDKFLAIIAHDLRNPLGGIYKLAEVVDTNYEFLSDEKLKKYIGNIRTTSDKVYELLDNLLQWALLQQGSIEVNKQEFSLDEVIRQNIELLKGVWLQKKISVVFENDGPCSVIADHKMINTVIGNLLTNALKFTPEHGKVSILVQNNRSSCIVSVTDTGVGISKADQEMLFEFGPEKSKIGKSKEKGIGLGLVLCKEFTQLNGGRIWVESEEGRGSSFYFSIPGKA